VLDRYGDHLEEAFHMQLKGTQRPREYLQGFAAIIDHLVHRPHISREAAPSFANGLRERREIKTPATPGTQEDTQ
jgi:hypothetical protein